MGIVRKCSHCGEIGHNLRTCSSRRRPSSSFSSSLQLMVPGGDRSTTRLRLFGVHLSSSSNNNNNNSCMEFLFSSSSSSSSSIATVVDDFTEKKNEFSDDNGYQRKRSKKGMAWSAEEHKRFLIGLEKLGRGDWRGISNKFVPTRTSTQVASHAQKFFIRHANTHDTHHHRSSLLDVGGGNFFCKRAAKCDETTIGEDVDPLLVGFSSKITTNNNIVNTQMVDANSKINHLERPILMINQHDQYQYQYHHHHHEHDHSSSSSSLLAVPTTVAPDLELKLGAPKHN
ncbi:probable transcription factor At5g61620 isoform X2 [Humulus lupulus]|uniref:probable transcription factor At5g61620 isoform X2 n=1 Tax=Humulus lupulus TaxID=3486 RepID=UPI002B404297|nr:probable transcription factor At5g61620 isoform X2 [Humulus lupulus]